MRLLAATALALVGLPGVAHAATRPIQAFDQPSGFAPVWMPRETITAQPGDTIRWQFEQPGNANAAGASHDIHLVGPTRPDEKLGVSYLNPVVEATVDETGTYSYYCSIHPDSMRGEIAVAAGDPTPVIDPGRPWESAAPPVVTNTGPPPLLNSAAPLTIFEAGDIVAPTLRLGKLTTARRVVRARVEVSEPGTVYARVMRGKTAVKTVHLAVPAGTSTLQVKLPKRHARYRLAVWVRDGARLESKWRWATLDL